MDVENIPQTYQFYGLEDILCNIPRQIDIVRMMDEICRFPCLQENDGLWCGEWKI